MEEDSSRMEFLVSKVENLEKTIENMKCSMSKKIEIFSKFVQEHIQLQKKTRLAEENIFEKCSLELSLFEPDIPNSCIKNSDCQNETGNPSENEDESDDNILPKTRQRKRKRGRDKTTRKSSKLSESGDENPNYEFVDVDQMKVKIEIEEEDHTDFELEDYNKNELQSVSENYKTSGKNEMAKDLTDDTDESDIEKTKSFEIIKSEKSRDLLVRKGYLFQLEKSGSNKKIWRCSEYQNYKCRARIHTKNNEIITEAGSHSHEPNEAKIKAKIFLNEVKEKAKSTCDVPKEIIAQCNQNLLAASSSQLPKISSIKHAINYTRRKIISASPDLQNK